MGRDKLMRQSQFFAPTLREVPADADTKSHQLLLRGGYIKQNAAGIYSYLPLAKRVLMKIEQIVREEMDYAGAVELLMPTLAPAEIWQESGRWYSYGAELMRVKDRHQRDFVIGPTHEEIITDLIRNDLNSYKKLPLNVYQIQTKFRDEKRPRFGLLRGREFIMKDAYSFHANQESLDEIYQKMYTAYSNIFTRLGLNFRAVIADSGAMGGKDTHEFMALSEIGEDIIVYSTESGYAANIEMAPCPDIYEKTGKSLDQMQKVATPEQKTIEAVSAFLHVPVQQCFKSMLYQVDGKFVVALVRGDHEVNDIKLKNFFGASVVELADESQAVQIFSANFGSLGPVGLQEKEVEIVADYAVAAIENGCCGANEDGFHFINVNMGRDYQVHHIADIRLIQEGDPSPDGKGVVAFARGIEIGHIFKLGTRYSEAMNARFLDENGKQQPIIMGCYGIGVSRLISAIIEEYHDEKGIIWPKSVAPYRLHMIVVNMKDSVQRELAEALYQKAQALNIEVLYDDRSERAGVKFADADLFGIPYRIIVGKGSINGEVEFKTRTGEVSEICLVDEVLNRCL